MRVGEARSMPSDDFDPSIPLDTTSRIERFARALLERANRRQTWIVYLDTERRPLPVLMPFESLPADPEQYFETARGTLQYPTVLATFAAECALEVGGESVLVVWERPSDEHLSQSEIDWVLALDTHFALAGLPVVAQLLCHNDGVRIIRQEELEADEVLAALQAYAAFASLHERQPSSACATE